jgi:hypothetical protein
MGVRRTIHAVAAALPILATAAIARADVVEACDAAYRQTQVARQSGKLIEARKQAVACGAEACPNAIKPDCKQWLAEIDATMPTVVFGATDASGADIQAVRVLVDGEVVREALDGKAAPIDPGPHKVRFETTGAPPIEQDVIIRQGEKDRRLVVSFKPQEAVPPARPAGPRAIPLAEPTAGSAPVWPWAVGGVGLAALGVAVGFGIDGLLATATLSNNCGSAPGNCTSAGVVARTGDTLDSLNGRKNRGFGVFIGAGLAGIGGVVAGSVGLKRNRRPRQSAARDGALLVVPFAGSRLVGVSCGGSF